MANDEQNDGSNGRKRRRRPIYIRRARTWGRPKAIDRGRTPRKLINYADIDHYRVIIEHPERWSRLFIRETLKRIAPNRNNGAHFRPVTPEDLIALRAEGIHLSSRLGIRLGD